MKGSDTSKNIAKMFNHKDGGELSYNVVKNIWCGKSKLYKCEFTEDTKISYDLYQSLIK